MKFVDLLTEQYTLPAEERSEWVTFQIEKLLSGTTLNFWHLGDLVSAENHRVLIGIVAWSGYDLRLLDALNQTSHKCATSERIDVFDIDACARASGGYDYIERIIPGIGKVYQTPVVGIWDNGTLKQWGSGAVGRRLIADRYNLNDDEITHKKGDSLN